MMKLTSSCTETSTRSVPVHVCTTYGFPRKKSTNLAEPARSPTHRRPGSPINTVRHRSQHDVDTIQYFTIQYNTIQYNTIQHNTIQHTTTQRNATQRNATQRNATQRNATQRNATQCNATQYNTMQCNAIQYNSIQYNTIQYNNKLLMIYLKSVQNMIDVFERWCYRRMLRISWTEHVTIEEGFNRATRLRSDSL